MKRAVHGLMRLAFATAVVAACDSKESAEPQGQQELLDGAFVRSLIRRQQNLPSSLVIEAAAKSSSRVRVFDT